MRINKIKLPRSEILEKCERKKRLSVENYDFSLSLVKLMFIDIQLMREKCHL